MVYTVEDVECNKQVWIQSYNDGQWNTVWFTVVCHSPIGIPRFPVIFNKISPLNCPFDEDNLTKCVITKYELKFVNMKYRVCEWEAKYCWQQHITDPIYMVAI